MRGFRLLLVGAALLLATASALADVNPHATLQDKFRRVRIEYREFRTSYGWVLESRWTDLANEITFGKPERVDVLLDELVREMHKARKRQVAVAF